MRPRENEEVHNVEPGQTLHEWLTESVPGYSLDRETQPIECLIAGQLVAPEHWSTVILRDDQPVILAVRPFGWSILAYAVVGLIAAAVAINSMPQPPTETTHQSASPTYDIRAQSNTARLMEPIPFAVGYNRHWMDLLTQPWKEYQGNDQYLHQLFSLGYGEFDCEKLQIGKTLVDKYKDVEYEVYGPNDPVTLFPDNVATSKEINGIELFGPNEKDYTGYTPWFTVVAKKEKANFLAADFSCRQGIFHIDKKKGRMHGQTASLVIEYQPIDANDKPNGDVQIIHRSYSGATRTPQRWTHRWKVPEGRYRIRARRTNNAGTDTRTVNSIHWEQCRAYYPSKQNYKGITKIAVRIRSSNNLSSLSEDKFNIKATALVPTWNGKSWTKPTKTRDIAWAFCHAIRSAHGGRLNESIIDMDNIMALHQAWRQAGETVCRVFDTRQTLQGALQEIVACGRGTVLMHNGKFFVVRDMQRMIRRHMYTPFMMQTPPQIERSFPQAGDNDSIIVEFFNQQIWQNDEILCQIPNHPADNPKRITLRGISDREQAWRIGLFEAAKMLYRRKQISFTTEMQALNSIWGDKVGVSYWLKGWGDSGEVIDWDGRIATLSDPFTLHDTKTNFIALARPDGTLAGPFRIEAAGKNRVIIADKPDFDLYVGDRQQRTQYQIGTGGAFCKDFLVTAINPAGDGRVSVTGVYDAPEVYQFEKVPVPPVPDWGGDLPRPVAPVITKFVIVQDVTDPQTATLSWQSTAGAREFIIEHSLDNKQFARVAIVTENTWSTKLYNGDNWFRVAGVADAQGDFVKQHIKLTGGISTNLRLPKFICQSRLPGQR